MTTINMNTILLIIMLMLIATEAQVGMVAYFDSQCPLGWKQFQLGQGRFIIGQNQSYAIYQTGGSAIHSQTRQQMAKHSHNTKVFSGASNSNSASGTYASGMTYAAQAWRGVRHTNFDTQNINQIKETGQGQSHNTLPPFVVLKACQKTLQQAQLPQIPYATIYVSLACAVLSLAISLFHLLGIKCFQKTKAHPYLQSQVNKSQRRPQNKSQSKSQSKFNRLDNSLDNSHQQFESEIVSRQ